jgi:bile acid:Na+ symporter, BASS family
MSLDGAISVLVTITLVEMMVVVGLQVTLPELVNSFENWRLLGRAAVANYVVVPSMTVALLTLVDASPMIATGFLIIAVCPGAPFGPSFAKIAGADVAQSVGLMVMLAGSSAVISPLLLKGLLPYVSQSEALRLGSVGILRALVIIQLLPLLIGLLLRRRCPGRANNLITPLDFFNKILTFGVVCLITGAQFRTLTEIRLTGFIGMSVLLAGSLLIGWLAGGPGRACRKSMALTTSLRNVGLGLVIATDNFAGSPVTSAALVYGIMQIVASLVVAFWWGREVRPNSSPGLSL